MGLDGVAERRLTQVRQRSLGRHDAASQLQLTGRVMALDDHRWGGRLAVGGEKPQEIMSETVCVWEREREKESE